MCCNYHHKPRFISSLSEQTIQYLQQIKVKKHPSTIHCSDSNLRPLDYESPPLPQYQNFEELAFIIPYRKTAKQFLFKITEK